MLLEEENDYIYFLDLVKLVPRRDNNTHVGELKKEGRRGIGIKLCVSMQFQRERPIIRLSFHPSQQHINFKKLLNQT